MWFRWYNNLSNEVAACEKHPAHKLIVDDGVSNNNNYNPHKHSSHAFKSEPPVVLSNPHLAVAYTPGMLAQSPATPVYEGW